MHRFVQTGERLVIQDDELFTLFFVIGISFDLGLTKSVLDDALAAPKNASDGNSQTRKHPSSLCVVEFAEAAFGGDYIHTPTRFAPKETFTFARAASFVFGNVRQKYILIISSYVHIYFYTLRSNLMRG